MLKTYGKHFELLLKLFEITFVFIIWFISYHLRFHVFDSQDHSQALVFLKAGVLLSLITSYFYHKHGLYNSFRLESRRSEAFTILRANFLSLFVVVFLLYFFAEIRLSRATIFT